MMNVRKLAKYALTTGLAFGLMAGAGTLTAKAAKPTVDYNYETQTLEVKPGSSDTSPYFYVATTINGKTTTERIEYVLNSSGAVETTKATKVDVSGLNYTKDIDFEVFSKTDSADGTKPADTTLVEKITVKAQPKKITAKLDPSKATITVTADSALGNGELNTNGTVKTPADWEFRTTYSNEWVNGALFSQQMLDQCSVYGTTLVIRQTAVDKTKTTTATVERLASKEVKLKIAKKANGPKATVDPINLTVNIPKGCEWRIVGDDELTSGSGRKDIWTKADANDLTGWQKNDTAKKYTIKELNAKVTANAKINHKHDGATNAAQTDASVLHGATIELRTVATEKKLGSKISYVHLPDQTSAPVSGTDFVLSPVINTKTNAVTGLQIENKSQKAMQIAVFEASKIETAATGTAPNITPAVLKKDATTDFTGVKFTAVAAGKKKVVPVKTAADGSYLVVRYQGTKATKDKAMVLSSDLAADLIAYPKAATKDLTVTLEAGANTGETNAKVNAIGSGNKVYYKIEDKEPKFVPLQSTKTSLSLSTELTISSAKITGAQESKYVVAYECDADGNVVKYGYTKVEASHIKPAPTPTP